MQPSPTDEVATALVRTEIAGGVATVTLDSPRNRNALSTSMRAQLLAALQQVSQADAVRVVVLTHAGPAFCAGMDLKETAVEQPGHEGVREVPAILQAISDCGKPVIAALAGPARAGGVGIMAAADIVLCSPNVSFSFSEVRIGVIPAVITVPVLDRMNVVAAREYLLTGAVFDADRARDTGLVNAVAENGTPEALQDLVDSYTAALLLGGPTAVSGTKRIVRAGYDDSDARFAPLLELSARQFSSAEGREGARAFAEKRPASWVAAGN